MRGRIASSSQRRLLLGLEAASESEVTWSLGGRIRRHRDAMKEAPPSGFFLFFGRRSANIASQFSFQLFFFPLFGGHVEMGCNGSRHQGPQERDFSFDVEGHSSVWGVTTRRVGGRLHRGKSKEVEILTRVGIQRFSDWLLTKDFNVLLPPLPTHPGVPMLPGGAPDAKVLNAIAYASSLPHSDSSSGSSSSSSGSSSSSSSSSGSSSSSSSSSGSSSSSSSSSHIVPCSAEAHLKLEREWSAGTSCQRRRRQTTCCMHALEACMQHVFFGALAPADLLG
ncbi:hypothetical protein Efla_005148 [Eimeria flavescens]